MTEKTAAEHAKDSDKDAPELRNQLIRRLAVAGGLVAILLGALAVFERLSQPADEQEVRVFTEPVPVAPRKMVIQPVTPMEGPATVTPAEPVAEAAPAEAAVASTAPPPPEVAAQPSVEPTPRSEPSARLRPKAAAPAMESEVPSDVTSAPPLTPPPVAPAAPARAAQQPSARVVATSPAAPAPPRLFSGFVLQAGVFASAQRAEELHAKLTLSGVPSSIETRVQVGPFRTRKEAAEAQQKLRELGIESILVAPRR